MSHHTPPPQASTLSLSRRLLDTPGADQDVHRLLGNVLGVLDAIIDGNTTGLTPAQYTQLHLEQLIDDLDRVRVEAGLSREEFFGPVPQ